MFDGSEISDFITASSAAIIDFVGRVGVAKAYIETAPTLDRSQLTKSKRSSYLYDKDGVLICSIADVEYRDWVDIQDIPERLQNAFIAVEDIRFEKHSGVDIKRLFSAMLEVLGNSNASGGSTITCSAPLLPHINGCAEM